MTQQEQCINTPVPRQADYMAHEQAAYALALVRRHDRQGGNPQAKQVVLFWPERHRRRQHMADDTRVCGLGNGCEAGIPAFANQVDELGRIEVIKCALHYFKHRALVVIVFGAQPDWLIQSAFLTVLQGLYQKAAVDGTRARGLQWAATRRVQSTVVNPTLTCAIESVMSSQTDIRQSGNKWTTSRYWWQVVALAA